MGHRTTRPGLSYRDPEATLTDKVVGSLHAQVPGIVERRFAGSVLAEHSKEAPGKLLVMRDGAPK